MKVLMDWKVIQMLTIAVDAGHGLYTAGKRCMKSIDPNETREWTLNSRIVEMLIASLNDYDCHVVRLDDPTGKVDVPVNERRNKCDASKADFCVAVHHNAGIKGGSGGGTVVYYDPTRPDNVPWCQKAYQYIVNRTGLIGNRSKKVNATSLCVARSKCNSIYLENGFMDSTTDTPIILTDDHARKTTQGIIDFLVAEVGLQKRTTPAPTPEPTHYYKLPCKVKINAPDGILNVRSGPGNNYDVRRYVKNGEVYTIVEEQNGWGKLKSGAGWIYLKYTIVKQY